MTVVCLGEALIDLIPDQGASIEDTSTLVVRVGGAPLNVAVHLKRAGIDARFAGTLSSDGFGSRIRALLELEGVEYQPVEPVDAPTRLAVINHQPGGPAFTFYGDRPADTWLTMANVNAALQENTRALYVTSLLMTEPMSARLQKAAIELARAMGTILVVSDPNPRRSAWPSQASMVIGVEFLLRVSHLTKLSLDDARELGWPTDPKQLLQHACERTDGAVVITNGAQGAWFSDTGKARHIAAQPVIQIDPTGAGDAFFAAVIAGFLREGELTTNVLESASVAGAAVAGRSGTL